MSFHVHESYVCSKCGATNIQLWLKFEDKYNTLFCVECADFILNHYIPAVPDEKGVYRPYNHLTDEAWKRWGNLPTLPKR